jgi:hypothetical protein
LPGFKCHYTARDGALELHELFRTIDMTQDVFDFRPYTRLKQLQHLLRTGQIDDQFYWTGSTDSHAPSEEPSQLADVRVRATG